MFPLFERSFRKHLGHTPVVTSYRLEWNIYACKEKNGDESTWSVYCKSFILSLSRQENYWPGWHSSIMPLSFMEYWQVQLCTFKVKEVLILAIDLQVMYLCLPFFRRFFGKQPKLFLRKKMANNGFCQFMANKRLANKGTWKVVALLVPLSFNYLNTF